MPVVERYQINQKGGTNRSSRCFFVKTVVLNEYSNERASVSLKQAASCFKLEIYYLIVGSFCLDVVLLNSKTFFIQIARIKNCTKSR